MQPSKATASRPEFFIVEFSFPKVSKCSRGAVLMKSSKVRNQKPTSRWQVPTFFLSAIASPKHLLHLCSVFSTESRRVATQQ